MSLVGLIIKNISGGDLNPPGNVQWSPSDINGIIALNVDGTLKSGSTINLYDSNGRVVIAEDNELKELVIEGKLEGYDDDGLTPLTIEQTISRIAIATVSEIEGLITGSFGLNTYFRGFFSDLNEIDDLVNNLSGDYVVNQSTSTIFQYVNGAWVDTSVSANVINLSNVGNGTNSNTEGGVILNPIEGEISIKTLDYIGSSVGPDQVYYKNNGSRAGRGGILFEEKIYNAGEWFTFDGLRLGLGGKGFGLGLTKAGSVDADDLGTQYDIGGAHSNYEDDLFTNHNTVGKGCVVTLQFYPTYLWTYNTINSKGWKYNGNWGKMNNNVDLGGFYNNPAGGKMRIGIDDDLTFKMQVFDSGEWKTVMYSSEPADARADGYRLVWNPYYGQSQLNVLPSVTTLGSSNGGATPTYANTHYISLDGTNDYIELDGVDTDVLDYTKEWSLGIEIESVSSVNDSSYITLYKRGKNEITLRKGGSNWGFYAFADGLSVAQANTWYAPSAGDKILIVSTATHIKYYLNGMLRANISYNQTNIGNYNDASGKLSVGEKFKKAYWYGGLNNLMIMVGAGSNLGVESRTEYFGDGDVSQMTFYSDVLDFLPLGESSFPNVGGLKSVVSGELKNGTESDFVQR